MKCYYEITFLQDGIYNHAYTSTFLECKLLVIALGDNVGEVWELNEDGTRRLQLCKK